MHPTMTRLAALLSLTGALALGACGSDTTAPQNDPTNPPSAGPTVREQLVDALPTYADIQAKLREIVAGQNGGLGFWVGRGSEVTPSKL